MTGEGRPNDGRGEADKSDLRVAPNLGVPWESSSEGEAERLER